LLACGSCCPSLALGCRVAGLARDRRAGAVADAGSETALLIAGVLVHDHRIGFLPTFVTCSIAVIVGDAIGYAVGRRWGERIARRISAKRWERARRCLTSKGAEAVVAARFVAVMRALVPAAAGAGRMPFRKFVVANSLGGVLWTATSILVGWAAGAAWELAHWFFLGAALVVAATIAIVWRVRRRGGTRSARDRSRGAQHANHHPCP
jgi:membrane-associated protein